MPTAPQRRALTLLELLVIVVVVAALIAGLAVAVYMNRPTRSAAGANPNNDTHTGNTGKPPEPPATRPNVLFVGNSFTFGQNMPQIVKALAKAAGENPDLGVEVYAPGGASLRQHYEGGMVAQRLKARQWDYVVLQENSMGPLEAAEDLRKYGQLLDEEIRKAGAKTILYLTWADEDFPQDQAQITREYQELARRQQAKVAPVGMAWQAWLRDHPKQPLHDLDRHHANDRGAYLTACVFYATIYGKSPVGLPGRLTGDGGMPLTNIADDEARPLQQAAWAAVQGWKQ